MKPVETQSRAMRREPAARWRIALSVRTARPICMPLSVPLCVRSMVRSGGNRSREAGERRHKGVGATRPEVALPSWRRGASRSQARERECVWQRRRRAMEARERAGDTEVGGRRSRRTERPNIFGRARFWASVGHVFLFDSLTPCRKAHYGPQFPFLAGS